jgi:hypothetical protein
MAKKNANSYLNHGGIYAIIAAIKFTALEITTQARIFVCYAL